MDNIRAWAIAERSSSGRETPTDQYIIDVIQSLLDANVTPEAAARSVTAIYEPLVKRNPNDPLLGGVWYILCSAVRTLGGNNEVNELLVKLLCSIAQVPGVRDEHGNIIRHEWGGRYWMDLPMWALAFREYGIAIDADEGMDEDEWLAQAAPFLNATSFSAAYLNRVPHVTSWSSYSEDCLMQALEGPYETPEPRARAAMYVPPAATWILLAGDRIYSLCKNEYGRSEITSGGDQFWWRGRGFSLQRWAFWKQRFGEIAAAEGLDDHVLGYARKAIAEIERIEDQNS
ncbi:hypothetical protein BDV26DRAFT_289817 [Aspergillus bertholletiae]|uniref:Uncharacterized protein n=1 Tax=Aspergillus bertholletiae TaxID=1226010 RepID=A0A5N7BH77_9EURO|nr:hypothetical protein BDV26DRAFT_289817 [Aspergillus bertholletiae]